jgi:lysophospholipase L1-like esterase
VRRSLLILPLAGIVASCIVLEVGLRVWFGSDGPGREYDTSFLARSPRWIPHPFLPYAGARDAQIEALNPDGTRESIITNSYGFRTSAFPAAKAPEDFVVLCFGESTTFGYRAPDNAATWPGVLETLLEEAFPERRVRVFNFGVDMASSAFSVVNLALVGVHLQPDLVIVYHGCNDVTVANTNDYRWDHSHAYRDLDGDAGYGLQARLPEWLLRLVAVQVSSALFDRWRGSNDLFHAATRPFAQLEGSLPDLSALLVNYRTLHSLAQGAGAEILFSTFQFRDGSNPLFRHFNQQLRAEFDRNAWHWIDQDALLPDADATLQVDPCHFTQAGRSRLAANFRDAIVNRGLQPAAR